MQLAREIREINGQYRTRSVREERLTDVALPAKFMLPPQRATAHLSSEGVYGILRDNITLDGKYVYERVVGKDKRGKQIEMRTKRIARELLIEAVPNIELSEEYVERLEGKIGAELRRSENDRSIGPSLPKVSARAVAQTVIPYPDSREEALIARRVAKTGIEYTAPREEYDMAQLRALARVSPRPQVLPTPETDLLETMTTVPRTERQKTIPVENIRVVLPIPEADYFGEMRTQVRIRAKRAGEKISKFGATLCEEFLGAQTPATQINLENKEKVGLITKARNWLRKEIEFSFGFINKRNKIREAAPTSACPTYERFVSATVGISQKKSPIPEKFWKEKYGKFQASQEPTILEMIGEKIGEIFSNFSTQN
jgi:hypothetical protein